MTKAQYQIFKTRNLKKTFWMLNYHAVLKRNYLVKWWWLKCFKFKEKTIVKFEKIKFLLSRKISIPTMDFNITTRCTLKCKDCGSLMPLYAKNQHYDDDFTSFKTSLDRLLKSVNHIYQFKLIGGEPLLNPNLAKMLEYACSKKQILLVEIVTNGTIIPPKELLETLKQNQSKAHIFISNYSSNLKIKNLKYDQVLEILEKNGIAYNTASYDFQQRGEIFARNRDEKGIQKEFENCWQKDCVSYFEGKIFVCTRAYYIEKALNLSVNNGECVDFRGGGIYQKSLLNSTLCHIFMRVITAILHIKPHLAPCKWANPKFKGQLC